MRIDIRKIHRLTSTLVTTGDAGFSTIHEPSIAFADDQVLLTGNWYAARSMDRGATWDPLDPYSYMSPGPETKFCCDQTVYYDREHDLLVWLLQYRRSAEENTLRVAVRHATGTESDWRWWDLRPTMIDEAWALEWFDYNHVAATAGHLFTGSNVLGLGGKKVFRSVVIRIPFDSLLSALESDGSLTFDYLEARDASSLRCAAGCTNVMYIAGHVGNDVLRFYEWPDASDDVTAADIPVLPWNDSAYDFPNPDGTRWLKRCTDRITAGWLADGAVGWMWTSGRLGAQRPFPFVRVVTVAQDTAAVISQSDIWSPDFAYAYPSACPNRDGIVGVTLFRGSGRKFPGHVVGARDPETGEWSLTAAIEGTHGPFDHKWGDYLTCQPLGDGWVACGFTLQGGPALTDLMVGVVEFDVV